MIDFSKTRIWARLVCDQILPYQKFGKPKFSLVFSLLPKLVNLSHLACQIYGNFFGPTFGYQIFGITKFGRPIFFLNGWSSKKNGKQIILDIKGAMNILVTFLFSRINIRCFVTQRTDLPDTLWQRYSSFLPYSMALE